MHSRVGEPPGVRAPDGAYRLLRVWKADSVQSWVGRLLEAGGVGRGADSIGDGESAVFSWGRYMFCCMSSNCGRESGEGCCESSDAYSSGWLCVLVDRICPWTGVCCGR